MARFTRPIIRWRRLACRCHPLALVCCLLLPPVDVLPLLDTLFENTVINSEDNTSSPDDGDELFSPTSGPARFYRRLFWLPRIAVAERIANRSAASHPCYPLIDVPGCEHGRRNGLGAPLRC